ncbi:MAG: ABC transporter ATP-binding protein [Chloroflexota bacterium]|nr:ABC transporter ATP-binding protein [Chloroflexota bacterium]
MTSNAVVVEDIVKAFGGKPSAWPLRKQRSQQSTQPVLAVDHISLTIRKNEIYGVLGANGSGKSTLIRLISTLLIPDSGSVTVFGHDVVREEHVVKRLLNRVSVEASFFKKLSPVENLMYATRLYGVPAGQARRDIPEILRALGIADDRFNRPLEQMSRGMQQKVAIARAFLTAPVLLLLDEPTTGLDPRSKLDVQEFILRLRDQHDATVLLTTHDMLEADALCDRIAIIEQGRIVVEGTPDELKAQARTAEQPVPSLEDAFMHFTGHALEEEETVATLTS